MKRVWTWPSKDMPLRRRDYQNGHFFRNDRYPGPKWPLSLWLKWPLYDDFSTKGPMRYWWYQNSRVLKTKPKWPLSIINHRSFWVENKILCWRRLFSFRVYVVSRRHRAGRILKAHVIISSGLRKIRNFSLVSAMKSSLMCYVPLDKSFKPFKNYSKSFQKAITLKNSAHT